MPARHLAVLFSLPLVAAAAHADPATDSFDRMLTHAAATTAVARPVEPVDPLLAALVRPLRDGRRVAARTDDDPVLAGFARMLAHAPTPLAAPVPAGTDPLVAALIEPLRDGPSAPLWLAGRVAPVRR